MGRVNTINSFMVSRRGWTHKICEVKKLSNWLSNSSTEILRKNKQLQYQYQKMRLLIKKKSCVLRTFIATFFLKFTKFHSFFSESRFMTTSLKKTERTLHTINLIAYVSSLFMASFLVILGLLIPSWAAPPYSSEKDIRRCPVTQLFWYQFPSHGLVNPWMWFSDTFQRCRALGWNPRPCDYEAMFLTIRPCAQDWVKEYTNSTKRDRALKKRLELICGKQIF